MTHWLYRHRWLLLLLLLAFGLRLVNSNGRSLWYDEAFSILFAQHTLPEMLQGTLTQSNNAAADIHPLLYYTLLYSWMQLVGSPPAVVRLLSALFGTITVAIGYQLTKAIDQHRHHRPSPSLLAALFIAIAPFHIYYSQEARMYALLGATTLAATLFWWRGWHRNDWRDWASYAICAALALYSHTLSIFFLASLLIWALWQAIWRWHTVPWPQLIGAHLLLLLLYLPWLLLLPSQLGRVRQGYWITKPGVVALLQTLLAFHASYDNQAMPSYLLAGAFFLSVLIPILALLEWRRNRRDLATTPSGNRLGVSLLLSTTLLPPLLGFLVSQIQPIYILRGFLPSALTYYVLLALVFAASQMPKVVKGILGGLTAVILTLSLLNHYSYASFPRPPFAAAAAWLTEHTAADTVIIHSNKLTFFPTHVYAPNLPQQFIADEPGSPSDTLAYATQETLGLFATTDLETAVSPYSCVYLVLFDTNQGTPSPHLTWLASHYQQQEVTYFNDLTIYTFVR